MVMCPTCGGDCEGCADVLDYDEEDIEVAKIEDIPDAVREWWDGLSDINALGYNSAITSGQVDAAPDGAVIVCTTAGAPRAMWLRRGGEWAPVASAHAYSTDCDVWATRHILDYYDAYKAGAVRC